MVATKRTMDLSEEINMISKSLDENVGNGKPSLQAKLEESSTESVIKKLISEQKKTEKTPSKTFELRDWQYLYGLFILTLCVRLFVVYLPSVVVFDEVHFGGFASNYLNRQYYLDVHPPLAKMLIAFVAYLGGIDYTYRFDAIGLNYLDTAVPYILMRTVSAVMGALMVPFAYVILKILGMSSLSCLWTSCLVAFENIFIAQFRLILLDSYLSFGTALSAFSYICFRHEATNPFGYRWWLFACLTGVGLGFTVSCKMVGLFTIALVGVFTLEELWQLWGNRFNTAKILIKHFFSRLFCLLGIPILIFVISFHAHLVVLRDFGTGGAAMSVEFQQSLRGGEKPPTFAPVGYGCIISLRHKATHGYLHSHPNYYPDGSKQQQVTLYPFNDANSQFRIVPKHGYNYTELPMDRFIPLRHGDRVRLQHVNTGRYLHSHNVPAHVSQDKEHHFEVSGYGSPYDGIGDTNDDWIVFAVDKYGRDVTWPELPFEEAYEAGIKASIIDFELPMQMKSLSTAKQLKSASSQALAQQKNANPLHDIIDQNNEIQNMPNEKSFYIKEESPIIPIEISEQEGSNQIKDLENIIESFKTQGKVPPEIIARSSHIKLIHPNAICHLSSFANKKYPAWGFEQQEVTCGRDTLKTHAVWLIETNQHPLFTDNITPKISYPKLSFWQKFIELNILMWNTNNKLTADHYFGSRPQSWPLLTRGLGFWNGFQQGSQRNHTLVYAQQHQAIIDAEYDEIIKKNPDMAATFPKPQAKPRYDESGNEVLQPVWKSGSFAESPKLKARHAHQQIYLIGNPIVWWSVTAAVILYCVIILFLFVYSHYRYNRPYDISFTFSGPLFLFLSYIFHFIPFFLMGRQLFLHHYLPAYYFGILFFGYMIEKNILHYFPTLKRSFYLISISIVIYVFLKFAPLTYGLSMTQEHCLSLKWLPSWDFDCSMLPSSVPPLTT